MTTDNQVSVRAQIFDALIADLLGPADGPQEEIAGTGVRDRYLLGQLAPRGKLIEPEEFDDLAKAGDETLEEGQPETDTPQSRSLMPSSIGLTFAVAGDVTSIQVSVSWGRYERSKSETLLTETGQGRTVWKRCPIQATTGLKIQAGAVQLVPNDDFPDVGVEGIVRRVGEDWIITLFLINAQTEPEKNQEEAWLFQPELSIVASDGSAAFRRRPRFELLRDADSLDEEERRLLDMQYRREIEFAIGHGVSVHAEVDSNDPQRATSIGTRIVPFYDVPETEARDVPGLEELSRDMKELSEMEGEQLSAALSVLPRAYEAWIAQQQERAEEGALSKHESAAKLSLERCRRTLSRLRQALEVIGADPEAAEAFRFANRAMWLQRIHSEYALRRRRGEDVELSDVDRPEFRSWYPFQLAYILIAIPSISNATHPDRANSTGALADLLWFPTGGGKTEAYLGVAAYTLCMRRLQGKLSGLDGRYGVGVIMRYTLRLLTIQQFQRASTLICAMEVIRQKALEEGDPKWGLEPFRIGLWVGARATPNTTNDAMTAIKEAKRDAWSGGGGTPYQLTSCPWCGSKIEPGRDLLVDRDVSRTLVYCSDKLGRCEFTKRRAKREGIPAVVVDEEIYRLLPALIIGTVDKFAQMPWRGDVASLFGRVTGRCERHGFLHAESEDTGRHQKKGDLPKVELVEVGLLRPPDLIIQDELHLISGPLGSMVGLYETAVDELCEWELEGRMVRPKVIASTATTRRAKDQVHSLFLREVEVFPPRGLDISDNFFSRQLPISPDHPGRRYFAVCAPGRSRPAVLIRVYVALLAAAQHVYEDHGGLADPWMTLIGYFNSLRELGGMRRLVNDDVQRRVLVAGRNDEEIPRPGLKGRQVRNIEELTSRLSSERIPITLDWLEEGFNPKLDEERQKAREEGERPKRRPIDVLLATNMVSVGVDIRRLGLMVVAGQPKNTAEYIQATSRIGRASPGLVATVLNWARPRDLSHYERFQHFHATFYQYVEALSVTPFAKRAIDRGLSGILVSLLRIDVPELTSNLGAGKLERTATYADDVKGEIMTRAWSVTGDASIKQLVEDMVEDRLDEWSRETEVPGRTLVYKSRRQGDTAPLLHSPGPEGWDQFTLLNSLRDVEPNVHLIKTDSGAGQEPPWAAPTPEERQ